MITKEKVLKVVARLKTVEKQADKKYGFKMIKPEVYFDEEGHPCGTVHCLAGWYVVACYKRPSIQKKIKNYRAYEINYIDGVHLMVKDLGFYSETSFIKWLEKYPGIWGNNKGHSVFNNANAFNYEGFSGAIKHLKEFAARLK